MKSEKLLAAIGQIDDDLIADAVSEHTKGKRRVWLKWGAAAACLCIIAAVGLLLLREPAPPITAQPGITADEEGVTIPPMNVTLSADAAGDMVAFFIYRGQLYVQYEWIRGNDAIVGEYLGTATGLIDEWTPEDGYVELAGSISGDFYEVVGYDPGFMLCMKYADGGVSTYVCTTGITLKHGAELYEDRLRLSEGLCAVSFETRESWNWGKGEVYRLGAGNEAVVAAFIEGLNEAEFMVWSEVVSDAGYTQSTIYDTELYHLYFELDNGTTVQLRLYENGYVRYQGLMDVCVKLSQERFGALIDLLDSAVSDANN